MSSDDIKPAPHASRRSVLATGMAAGGMLLTNTPTRVFAQGGPAPAVRLVSQETERTLPARFWGYNCPVPFVPFEDPAFVPALKALGPQFLRFPGGTIGNYYNWHTGYMEVPDAGAAGSPFRELFAHKMSTWMKKLHPKGFWIEQWDKIARDVSADLVINANLETSTPDDQAARFADMKKKGIKATHLELGNEFFIAMFDDMGRKRFPDPQTTNKIVKEFYDAIRPQLPAGAKVAVQSSGSAFEKAEPSMKGGRPAWDNITQQRIWEWDQALKPEPWFDAVTVHLYPTETRSAGADLVKALPGSVEAVFDAMVARADGGYDRVLNDLAGRVPGKEIWVTEYGAFDPQQMFYGSPLHFTGLWLHQVTREMLTMMRHPQVTVSCYHAIYFAENALMSSIALKDGGSSPTNASLVQSWLFHASRGPGCTWQRLRVDGANRVSANGTIPGESFLDVEAGLFRKGTQHTLFVHNASRTARRIDLSQIAPPQAVVKAETIVTPDLLASLETAAAAPQPLTVVPSLEAPAYSLTKVTWSA